ncbi:hypothetical protein [Arthrobacter sp. ZGTC412]|uniref:hypothetical protein n=1 Tax=Arthrobacter sp. ZGTC412 TaxID=2058900 RepID=UPI0011B03A33|nr:hypothetical protein [Arthrobacter sp. ZGTC412]
MSSNLEPLIPAPLDGRKIWVVILGFAAAMCWWLGIVGVIVSGGGGQALQVFLAVPVLVTVGTALAAHQRHRRRRGAKHVRQPHSHKMRRGLPAKGSSVVLLCGFTAALCWWIAIVAVATTGGGTQVFLAIPVLASVVTFLAARKRPAAA